MSEVQLYHGSGSGYSPDPRHLERLISKRFKARGISGVREGKGVLYTSTCLRQSEHYTDTPGGLFIVSPGGGALITWIPGVADLILSFESYLRKRWLNDRHIFKGKNLRTLLNDTRGNVGTIDAYLSQGRQMSAASHMIDSLLDLNPPLELQISDSQDLEVLKDHNGEVIVQGPLEMVPVNTAVRA